MIRVVLVDDHPIVLDGIALILEEADDIRVTGRAMTIASAREIVQRERPDVLVLDLGLPDGNGLQALQSFRALQSPPRIVVFTAYAGAARVAEALENGADSYVLKGTPSSELLRAIRTVATGKPYVPAALSAEIVGALRDPGKERLTGRERQILTLMARGLANKEIARELGITERTVKFHVSEILARLAVSNRAHAVAVAQERGLL